MTGAAEARAIEAVGRAEAERMRMKASAYKQYGDAAVMALVLEALPQVLGMTMCFINLKIDLIKISILSLKISFILLLTFRSLPKLLHHSPRPMKLCC